MTILSLPKDSKEYEEFVKSLMIYSHLESYVYFRTMIFVCTKTDKYYKVKIDNRTGEFEIQTRGDTDFVDFLEVKPVEKIITTINWEPA